MPNTYGPFYYTYPFMKIYVLLIFCPTPSSNISPSVPIPSPDAAKESMLSPTHVSDQMPQLSILVKESDYFSCHYKVALECVCAPLNA